MAKYQKYAEYQDSGVEWLGDIPSHWYTVSLKMLIDVRDGTHDTPSYVEPNFSTYPLVTSKDVTSGRVDLSECKHISEFDYLNIIKRSGVSKGDILMPMIGTVGSPVLVEEVLEIAIKNLALFKTSISNEKLNSKFLFYFLNSEECEIQFSLEGKGGVQNFVSLGTLRNLVLPLTKINEQIKIANFLDHETAKIDSLITKQEKLIELLKEKRQAVISHAVTKGLNPDVNMKDSGVEWLGQVPEHWVVTRAKFVANVFIPQRNKPELNDSEGFAWVTMDDMKNKYIQNVNRYVTKNSAILAGSKVLEKGAVITSCVGNFGVTSINKIDVIINQQLQAFIPKNIKAEYLQSLVSISKNYFELIGTAATLVYVNQEGFQNLPVLLPPHDEQVAICLQIENYENKYDQLINLGLQQIKILQERRTALISSAVTGKINVTNWQKPQQVQIL